MRRRGSWPCQAAAAAAESDPAWVRRHDPGGAPGVADTPTPGRGGLREATYEPHLRTVAPVPANEYNRPRVIFVNSMSDLFHDRIPDDYVGQVFDVMAHAPQHTFQVLTKRPDRLAALAPRLSWPENVWMGVTIENRRFVERADVLRQVPAAVRFISAEPLLTPLSGLELGGIDWLIAGGESGHRHRPAQVQWFRDLRDRCLDSGVAFFFKQWGGRTPKAGGRLLDGREWNEMPPLRAA